MVFGVSYRVMGRADCPYFARAERLAQMLKSSLSLSDRDIQIEMISPSSWSSHVQSVCRRLGFGDFLSSQESSLACDRGVLVWHPGTGRLVGGEKAFRKEVAAKYAIECDVSFGTLRAMARENAAQCDSVAQAREARILAQPLLLALVGPAGAGKTSLARRVAAHYSLVHVSTGDMLRRIASGAPAWGSSEGDDASCSSSSDADAAGASVCPSLSAEQVSLVRSCMSAGELVPDSIVLPLMAARLAEEDVRRSGAVLDGLPRTAAQAGALRDMEVSLGSLAALVRLQGLDASALAERLRGRRVDPLTGDIYHTTLALPPSALVLSRLSTRVYDGADASIGPQLRHYEQHIEDVMPLYREGAKLRTLDAAGDREQVWTRLRALLDPIAAAVAARRLEAASRAAKEPRATVRDPSPLPSSRQAGQDPSAPSASALPAQHTPGSIAFTVAPELPSSRRGSLINPASSSSSGAGAGAAAAAAPAAVPGPSSRAGSRRSSGVGADPRSIAHALLAKGGTGGAGASTRSSSSRPGSKPTSRRGSTNLGVPGAAGAAAGAGGVATAAAFVAGGDIPSRRLSNRRSARLSGQGPLVPAGHLNSTAAAAGAGKRASGTANVADQSAAAAAAAAVPAVTDSVAAPVPSVAGGDEDEAVQLHRRGSSKRATGTRVASESGAADPASVDAAAPRPASGARPSSALRSRPSSGVAAAPAAAPAAAGPPGLRRQETQARPYPTQPPAQPRSPASDDDEFDDEEGEEEEEDDDEETEV